MEFKDYYGILGVAPDADDKEIKKKYKELARKYHPDVNSGDTEAEKKFKEINEAYHAIADPQKRKKYDDLRRDYQQWQARGGQGDFDWASWQASPGGQTYTRTMSEEEFANMFGDLGGFGGFGGFSDFFSNIFGMDQGFAGNDYAQTRRTFAGRDLEGEVSITLEEAYSGTQRIVDIGNRRIQAKIPKGVKDGSKVRLAGQGQAGSNGGKSGDLYLKINLQKHPVFAREGDDLTVEVPVDFYTAVLGGEVKVKTVTSQVSLKIPPQTNKGKTFRLKGKGMPKLNNPSNYGDLYAKISIVLPNNLTSEEINALRALAQKRKG